MKEYLLDHMTWKEIHDNLNMFDAVLIPVGATEQHAAHLEIRFDAFSATEWCYRTAKMLNARGHWVVVAPTVSYGVSWYHQNFPGTLTLTHETFRNLIKDLCRSLARHKFKNVIIVNSHGGNTSTLMTCLDELNAEERIRVVLTQWFSMAAPELKRLGITTPSLHAGEAETSFGYGLGMNVRRDMLSQTPLNRMEKQQQELGFPVSSLISYDPTMPGANVLVPMDFIEQITEGGVIGDATLATEEKGKCIVDYLVSTLGKLIADLSGRK